MKKGVTVTLRINDDATGRRITDPEIEAALTSAPGAYALVQAFEAHKWQSEDDALAMAAALANFVIPYTAEKREMK
jgi:hypothetical protein